MSLELSQRQDKRPSTSFTQSFFFESISNPRYSSEFAYDQLYKSARSKKRFEKDPQFGYFNSLLKMKNKLEERQDLYNNIFGNNIKTKLQNLSHEKKILNKGQKLSLTMKKLNSRTFKIQKRGLDKLQTQRIKGYIQINLQRTNKTVNRKRTPINLNKINHQKKTNSQTSKQPKDIKFNTINLKFQQQNTNQQKKNFRKYRYNRNL